MVGEVEGHIKSPLYIPTDMYACVTAYPILFADRYFPHKVYKFGMPTMLRLIVWWNGGGTTVGSNTSPRDGLVPPGWRVLRGVCGCAGVYVVGDVVGWASCHGRQPTSWRDSPHHLHIGASCCWVEVGAPCWVEV